MFPMETLPFTNVVCVWHEHSIRSPADNCLRLSHPVSAATPAAAILHRLRNWYPCANQPVVIHRSDILSLRRDPGVDAKSVRPSTSKNIYAMSKRVVSPHAVHGVASCDVVHGIAGDAGLSNSLSAPRTMSA